MYVRVKGEWLVTAGATLVSFLAALVHFSIELFVFKTMSLKSAANPMIIAGQPRSLSPLQASCSVPKFKSRDICPVQWFCIKLCCSQRLAGLSALWMGAGWNYYTNLATEIE
jgi:hypothetical protein